MVRLGNFSPLIISLILVLPGKPALTHTVKVSGTVAATFHIEPRHNPKAGEPAQAWFALTQQGGAVLPLTDCDCKLAVYDKTDPTAKSPVQTPVLKPISTEQYREIPAATLVFPQSGNYELVLSGAPKGKTEFQPFQLNYAVTVTAGMPPQTSEKPHGAVAHASHPDSAPHAHSSWIASAIAGGALLSLGILGFATRQFWHKNR